MNPVEDVSKRNVIGVISGWPCCVVLSCSFEFPVRVPCCNLHLDESTFLPWLLTGIRS